MFLKRGKFHPNEKFNSFSIPLQHRPLAGTTTSRIVEKTNKQNQNQTQTTASIHTGLPEKQLRVPFVSDDFHTHQHRSVHIPSDSVQRIEWIRHSS